jgi:hypothetical protein
MGNYQNIRQVIFFRSIIVVLFPVYGSKQLVASVTYINSYSDPGVRSLIKTGWKAVELKKWHNAALMPKLKSAI